APTEHMLHQQQMAGRRYRQILRQAFHDAENRRFDQVDMNRAPAGYGGIEGIELHEFLRKGIARLPPGMQVGAFGETGPGGNKKDGNSRRVCTLVTPFYSAVLIPTCAARISACHVDTFSSASLSPFALCAPDPRRVRHRRSAG